MPSTPVTKEQRRLASVFCESEFKRVVSFAKARFKLKGFKPYLEYNFRTAASCGGYDSEYTPFVHLCIREYASMVGDSSIYIVEEYNFLQNKPGIGDVYGNWKRQLSCLIAHELAHAIVETPDIKEQIIHDISPDVVSDIRGHGLFWQHVYRILRQDCELQPHRVRNFKNSEESA